MRGSFSAFAPRAFVVSGYELLAQISSYSQRDFVVELVLCSFRYELPGKVEIEPDVADDGFGLHDEQVDFVGCHDALAIP